MTNIEGAKVVQNNETPMMLPVTIKKVVWMLYQAKQKTNNSPIEA